MTEAFSRIGGQSMVKGISRQIVVIDSPDQKLFEKAIFIVRNDAFREGVTARALVQEARRVARNCAGERARDSLFSRCLPWITAFIGGGFVAVAWLMTVFFSL
ncbi:MAG: hypothetical protein IKO14_02760 [Oscillibacter sp.]|nr:hypothetical protein [Oscillibacter sp.]